MRHEDIIESLYDPVTYDEKTDRIRLVQTHISYVFLTGSYAYKIKKRVDFGFLDFSTLEKRKHYCEEELRLNRRLCKDMYVDVLPITRSGSNVRVGGNGEVIEYTVKMREIPQQRLMSNLLEKDRVNKKDLDSIARKLSVFHRSVETNEDIQDYGSVEKIRYNWDENFNQTRRFFDKTISRKSYSFIRRKINDFILKNTDLFEYRIKKDRIRECHGDLHSRNIFISDKIYIYDAIEFNKRFRYSDVASDIAFLAMDLDFRGKHDLHNSFLSRYLYYSGETTDFLEMMPFYKCYRAYVRGKVESLKLNDPNITVEDKEQSKKVAAKYFNMSSEYAANLTC